MARDPVFILTYLGIGALIAVAIWVIGLAIYKLLIVRYIYGKKREWRQSTVSAYYKSDDEGGGGVGGEISHQSSRLLDVSSYYVSTSPTVPNTSPTKSFNSMSFNRYEYNDSSRSTNSILELSNPPILPPWESAPNYISPDKWFEFITGTSEYEFTGSKRGVIIPYYDAIEFDDADTDLRNEFYQQWQDGPHLGIKNSSNGRLYSAGMFYTASIRELSESVHELAGKISQVRKTACKFIIDVLENKENERMVSPAYLQSLPENENAMFQVASKFNCVESPDVSISPDKNSKYFGSSQGACSSVSAGPGAITRVYCPYYGSDKKSIDWGQTSTHQIELLGNLQNYFTVVNGFVMQQGTEETIADETAERNSAIENVKVGVHVGIDVSFGEFSHRGLSVLKNPHKISQVLCGAMSLRNIRNRQQKDSAIKEQVLLEAAYKGAFLAAIKHGSSRLFLTMLGTDKQDNEIGDIFNAIWYAYRDFGHGKINTSLKEVHLVIKTPVPELEQFHKYMSQAHVPIEIHRY